VSRQATGVAADFKERDGYNVDSV